MVFPTRKHLSAWLGIFAMCLIVFVPVASQLLVAVRANEPLAALCSVTQPAGDGAHHAGDPLAACGYCDLLADQMVIPPVPPVIEFVALRVLTLAVATLSTRFTPLGAFPSGRPRGPPVSLQISL